MATSGLAVLFSGLTVIVSLAGLWMIDNNAIRSMALGAILVVAVSLVASATLLPALIALLGPRAYAPSSRFIALGHAIGNRRSLAADTARRSGERWTDARDAAPGRVAVLAASARAARAGRCPRWHGDGERRAAAVPGGQRDARRHRGGGVGVRARRAGAGPDPHRLAGARAPRSPAATTAVARVAAAAVRTATALVTAIPKADGESPRDQGARRAAAGATSRRPQVGGVTAAQNDIRELISGSMWKVLLFVLGLSYLVLLVLLRSVVLPLKAVLMNLLSVGAARACW